ncbi:MAG: transposase [bacterium]|nr:transposase [bacterium]
MQRKEPLLTGNIYHVMSKSIAGYSIFSSEKEYARMLQILRFFSYGEKLPQFSKFITYPAIQKQGFEQALQQLTSKENKLTQTLAYCLMPTHIHLILKQLKDNGISISMGNTLNAYARYFNTKHKRQGPLWAGRFKNVPVGSDEQLLHLSRYIHLNPVTAGLANNAAQWEYSSYSEYVTPDKILSPLCDFRSFINEPPATYRAFVADQAGYQRELARIKKLAIE